MEGLRETGSVMVMTVIKNTTLRSMIAASLLLTALSITPAQSSADGTCPVATVANGTGAKAAVMFR